MAEYKNVENIMQLFNEKFKKTRQLIQKGETHLDNLAEGFLEADRVIREIPTADVVPVVRCKDCKYADPFAGSCVCTKSGTPWFNDEFNICMEANDYCSYGERRCEE